MRYTNFTNLDSRFARPAAPGDRLCRGWIGETTVDPADPHRALERIYERHNYDTRPDGHLCPSMSIGDVVVLGETAWSVDVVGFVPVELAEMVVLDCTWREAPR